jgi:hypothetical protein
MCDATVHHQRYWTRREVPNQLDVPTLLTPASHHLLCFHFVCCTEKFPDLVNHPVVILRSTRVGTFCNQKTRATSHQ